MDVGFLAQYPDFLSFLFVMLLTGLETFFSYLHYIKVLKFFIAALLAFGVKESSNLNNVFTFLNLATITVAIVAGSIKGKQIDFVLCCLFI